MSTESSVMTVSRKTAEVSLRARGRISSCTIASRQPGRCTTAFLLPKLPKVGLARWKAMRTSSEMNS